MPNTTHRSLERGLVLLEAIAAGSTPVSLSEVARRAGLHRSTAHHLLKALVTMGYLQQDDRTRGYRLTSKLFGLAGRSWTPEQLGGLAQPVLAELSRLTGEGSSMAAYHGGAILIIAKHDHAGPVRVVQNVGAERPPHATAVGKAILAWLSPAELAAVLGSGPLQAFTDKTLIQRDSLTAELKRVRLAGYAIADEEHVEGIRCIAAPVFGPAGSVIGALCALGPKHRMTHQRLRSFRAPLLELAGTLSERLGWQPNQGQQIAL